MKRILVTGGSGLVGKALEKVSAERGAEEKWIFLSSRDGDLRNRDAVMEIFDIHRPTHVIHLAAKVGGLFANMKYKVDMFEKNILIF